MSLLPDISVSLGHKPGPVDKKLDEDVLDSKSYLNPICQKISINAFVKNFHQVLKSYLFPPLERAPGLKRSELTPAWPMERKRALYESQSDEIRRRLRMTFRLGRLNVELCSGSNGRPWARNDACNLRVRKDDVHIYAGKCAGIYCLGKLQVAAKHAFLYFRFSEYGG